MLTLTAKTISKGVLTLNIVIPPDELQPHLERAATELQRERPLPGFRPGKAPFATARQAFGEMKILERALAFAVPAAYVRIVKDEHFLTIGEPEVEVTKLTPNQPVEFIATVAVLPAVKLGNYRSIREARQPITITETEIDEIIDRLCTMRAKQVLSVEPATRDDRVLIDVAMSKAGVPVEGGQARGHAIDLFKPYAIPGFLEMLIDLKAEERKQFSLPFPKDHYNKALAGSTIDFDVTVRSVYRFERPEVNDTFAASLGKFANVTALREQLKINLKEMKEADERARLERAITQQLIKQAAFGELPQVLIASEVEKLLARQRAEIEKDGGNWADYLAHVKKTEEELARDFLPEATTRIQAALIVRALSEAENITVSPEEVAVEQQAALTHYQNNSEARASIASEEYTDHLKHVLLTRKVMERIKEIATSSSKS